MQESLKKMIFKVIEEHVPLKEFEFWLYNQEDLSNRMDDQFILGLFEFNYNQRGAMYEFKKTFLKFFDHEEFILWKVRANLQDLVDGRDSRDRILSDFYQLGYDELPFLHSLGYYAYELEDAEYLGIGKESVIQNLKKDAALLLQEITEEENVNPNFKIMTFNRKPKLEFCAEITAISRSKEWWQFWK